MGKIVYRCVVEPDYLDELLGTTELPNSLRRGIEAKKLNSEATQKKLQKFFEKKFPAAKKEDSKGTKPSLLSKLLPKKKKLPEGYKVQVKPCWFLDAVDKLDEKGVKVTDCKEGAYDPVDKSKALERTVRVSCYFDKGNEVKRFIENTLPDDIHSKFKLAEGTAVGIEKEVREQMEPQLTKLKKATIENLTSKDKVKVKINYTLKY